MRLGPLGFARIIYNKPHFYNLQKSTHEYADVTMGSQSPNINDRGGNGKYPLQIAVP